MASQGSSISTISKKKIKIRQGVHCRCETRLGALASRMGPQAQVLASASCLSPSPSIYLGHTQTPLLEQETEEPHEKHNTACILPESYLLIYLFI